MNDAVQIDERFCGPAEMANGGYACGLAAAGLGDGAATVRLSRPVPLGRPLRRERADDGAVSVRDGDTLVAEARASALDVRVPEAPTLAEAEAASRGFSGFEDHPFPTCFVCGPERTSPDGLRVFPGAVAGRELVACVWRPDPSLAAPDGRVAPEYVWAALDCPGAFAAWLTSRRVLVLGQLAVAIDERPRPGEPCVVMGWPIAREHRKDRVGTALVSEAGRVYARAEAIWIALKQQ